VQLPSAFALSILRRCRLSFEQVEQFRIFVHRLVANVTSTQTSITKKDVEQLEASARKAAASIGGVASSVRVAPKGAAGTSGAVAGRAASTAGSLDGGDGDRRFSADVSDGRSSGHLGAALSASTADARLRSTSAGGNGGSLSAFGAGSSSMSARPSSAELAAAARRALEATALTVGTRLEALPEPRIFASRRKMGDLRAGFADQVANKAVERLRRVEVDRAFAAAAGGIAARAEAVETRQKEASRVKAVENSAEVRRHFAEQVRCVPLPAMLCCAAGRVVAGRAVLQGVLLQAVLCCRACCCRACCAGGRVVAGRVAGRVRVL
jgi:hypothetical protein